MRSRFVALTVTLALMPTGPGIAQGRTPAGPIKPAPGWEPPTTTTPDSNPATPRPGLRPAQSLADQDSYYDPANPVFHQLQKANQSLAGLPLDRAGYIDWMRLLNDGQITPRADLRGSETVQPLDLDVVLKNTRRMPWVRFPHRAHTLWLDCANCHPAPFEKKAGAAKINMESIFRGQWCGMCHDRVAFITHLACERCHSVDNPSAAVEQ